jgi:hypothetical protein
MLVGVEASRTAPPRSVRRRFRQADGAESEGREYAECRGSDNLDWQRLEADTGCRADSLQTPAHHSQGVLSRKQEYGPGVVHSKLAQTGGP